MYSLYSGLRLFGLLTYLISIGLQYNLKWMSLDIRATEGAHARVAHHFPQEK